MIQGGTIRFILTGDTSGLDKASKNAKRQLSQIRDEFKSNIMASAKFAAAMVAAGTAIAVGLTVKGLKAVDAQAKLARSLNGTVDGLNALKMAAGDAGLDGLESSLNRLNRRLGAVEMGGGPAVATVERLGINLEHIQSLDVDEKLAYISDRIVESGVSSQEAARHLQQLGFEQRAAVEMFAQGGDAIRKYRGEVDALGLSMTEIDTTKIEMANDAMGIFGDVTQAASQRLAIAAAGPMQAIASAIEEAWIQTDNFGLSAADFEKKFASAMASAIENTADVIRLIESNSTMAQFGIMGYLLFGKKGAAIGGAIGFVFQGIRDELRLLGVGVDDDAAKMARLVDRAEALNRAMEESESARSRGQNMDREVANYQRQLDLVNSEMETLRASMSEDQWAEFNQFFVDGSGAAGSFADALDRVAERVRNSSTEAAEAARRVMEGRTALGGGAEAGMSPEEEEALRLRLEQLQESFMTERELLQAKYDEERQLLRDALAGKLMDEEEYMGSLEQLAQRHQDRVTQMETEAAEARKRVAEAEQAAKYNMMRAIFGDLSTLMNTESRKLFEVGKAAAIANAIVDTHAGMTKALAQGGFRGIAMAAAVAAKGFASVSAIRSQSFGGGGAGAAATGSNTAAVNAATTPAGQPQQQQAGPSTVIRLSGDFFGESQIRSLIERINETTRNGGRIVLG